ncbi:16S rRNA (cytidine(1402)-2'-O)-methyltransferase [Paenibacillus sp. IB182496]|uniref:Ribosomal RNA small subunit methyltransferase I n=1 Tax=Paenibacillus sabuli TaxID=2772509 RepID=A0A927GU59_9BACL|nr:16S rRNA (cytidine(1402)-2'-O)-methyltransferase [Paenibacillus sabuli]MBD2848328.1 16S rRNA (cytidine(1402)-2'-O)-methyltransferase [Paenibacillus sabuli]
MQVQRSFTSGSSGTADVAGAGKLYLVGTPIGNLEDITYRAVRTLREVDWIAAEDTRQTRKLLTHYEIHTRLVSYHEHNKQASGGELLRLVEEGASLALVSDAGLPAISDPGADLVSEAVQRGIAVVPIPGANAALSALIASGLSTQRFHFAGFPPRDKKGIAAWLEGLQRQEGTLLVYESPHRVKRTLEAMLEAWGDRRMVMARELTKRHEELARGLIRDCLDWLEQQPPLGEYCLAVEGAEAAVASAAAPAEAAWWSALELEQHVTHYEGLLGDRKQAMKRAAADRGMTRREVYNALL